jgi:solute carrier family 35 protein C2
MEDHGLEPPERGLLQDITAQDPGVKPPSGDPRRKSKHHTTNAHSENKRSSESEDGSGGSMSASEVLEMDDLASDAGSEADEETGLTVKESRKFLQTQRQSVPLDARIAGNTTITKEAKKLADQHVLKDLLVNAMLIGLWYIFSLSISIVSIAPSAVLDFYLTSVSQYNKWMFGSDHLDFHFPLFTTSLHMLVQFSLASLVLLVRPSLRPRPPPFDHSDTNAPPKPLMTPFFYATRLLPCGTATSLDIGLGNTSLRFVTLTFLTMCKSSSLAFVLLFAFLFRLEQPSWKLCAIIATMTAGVVMMVAGETEFNPIGFVLVIASAFFSGFRWALTQILLLRHPATSNPYATIFFLAPIMFVTLIVLALFVEGPRAIITGLQILCDAKGMVSGILLLVFPGCLAFGLISSEFALLKRTSVVTLSAAGIVFHDPLTPINVSGLVVTIASIAVYNYLKITKMRREAREEVAAEVVQRMSMDMYDAVREDSIEIDRSSNLGLQEETAEGSKTPGKPPDPAE